MKPEYMPASDALADAETLRRVLDLNARRPTVRYLLDAANFGYRALDAIAGRNLHSAGFHPAHVAAVFAARNAFRAVPGLRG